MDAPYPYLWYALIIFILVANFFLNLSRTAINQSHKSRLDRIADEHPEMKYTARSAKNILLKPGGYMALISIGITVNNILLGVIGSVFIATRLDDYIEFIPQNYWVALLAGVLLLSYIILVLGEFLPHRLALQNPEAALMQCTSLLRKLRFIVRPFIFILSGSSKLLLSTLGISFRVEEKVTEDQVKEMIEQGTETGTFEKTEKALVDHVFHMSDQTAYSLMTPRTQMEWLDLTDSLKHNLNIIRNTHEPVLPVGRESLDDFCGVIYTKDLLNASLDNKPLNLTQFIKKPMFIPRSMETFKVLEKFRKTGILEAVVLDEYGGVIGFITLQDILMELIGDTKDINEPEAMQIVPKDDSSWYIEGLCSIDDFKKKFGIDELPEEEHDHYQTMGGFVTSLFGYIPKRGETVKWDRFSFEIQRLDRYRIDKIICTELEPPEIPEKDKKEAESSKSASKKK